MSILIPGMKMPKVCIDGYWYGNCPMSRLWCAQRFAPKGYTMEQVEKDQQDKLPSWCPLVELPPHGDLIDRSKIVYTRDDSGLRSMDFACRAQLENVIPVIPAEE